MIDLHLHTTASDGRSTPRELVDLVAAAGLTIISVTDHDTTAAVSDVQACARDSGIEVVPGIEITAVADGRDVHMLGYFMAPRHAEFQAFLADQRKARIARAEQIGTRLAELGAPVDLGPLLALARLQSNLSLGRPAIARALVAAGHARDIKDAFNRWLGQDAPAFVERVGPTPERVVEVVHQARGLASLAHPGRTKIDDRIPSLKEAGLDAIEVYHSDHGPELIARYAQIAEALALLVTGGTDFHADPASSLRPGAVTLPQRDWDRLREAHARVS